MWLPKIVIAIYLAILELSYSRKKDGESSTCTSTIRVRAKWTCVQVRVNVRSYWLYKYLYKYGRPYDTPARWVGCCVKERNGNEPAWALPYRYDTPVTKVSDSSTCTYTVFSLQRVDCQPNKTLNSTQPNSRLFSTCRDWETTVYWLIDWLFHQSHISYIVSF